MRKEDEVVVSPSSNHVGIDLSTTTISSNNNKSALSIPPLLAPPPSSNIHSQQRRSRSRSRRPLSPTAVSAAITTNAKTGTATIVTPESSPVLTSRPIMAREPQQVPLPSPQQQTDNNASFHDHSNSNDLDWPDPLVSSSSPSLEDQQTAATPLSSSASSQRRQRYRRHTPPNNNEIKDNKASVIPESYVLLIQKAFGHDTNDLYRDVLQVDRFTASAKDIRIAYFRRGRQVLASNTSEAESERNKLQFQAVSMAYEILTNPTWKRYYDEHGLTTQQHPPHQMMMNTCIQSNSSMHSNSTSYASLSEESVLLESLQQQLTTVHADSATPKKNNRATSSDASRGGYSSDSGTYGHSGSTPPNKKKSKKHKQKRSSSSSQRRRSRSVGVRWHDYVEELVFEKEKENEEAARVERRRQAKVAKSLEFAACDDDNDDREDEQDMLPSRRSKDKKKRKKHRVLVEVGDDEEDLSNHLSKLNRETGTFVVGFFDQLEAGLDHLMNLDGDGANMEIDDFDKMLLAKQKIAYRRTPSMDEDDDNKIGADAGAAKAPQSEPSLAFVPTSVRRPSFSSFKPSSYSSGKPTDETTQDAAATTVGGGNLVTDLFQQMTASFDDFLLLERSPDTKEIKLDGTGNEKLRVIQATSTSQHTNTKREGNNKIASGQSFGPTQLQSQHNAAEHNNDEVMTGPLMEWLQPTTTRASIPDPVPTTIPASSKNGRNRSSSRHTQVRLMATASSPTHSADRTNTEELMTGPVAEWGRETNVHADIQTSQSSPHLVALDPQDQQGYQNDFVPPPHPAPSSEQLQQQNNTPAVELYSLDDDSSVPAPPVQEVRKPQRSSRFSSQFRDQHHDDDMSSLSESFAAYIWSDPTSSCWTMHPPMTDDTSFKRLTVAAPAMDGTPATATSVTPSLPRTALPSILKTPKFQPTSPQLPVQLNSDGYHPSNEFNDLDDYDDDPSSRGGGYSTPSNSIVSGSDMQSSNSHNIDFFPNIRITIHDDNDYCFAGCNNGHYEDARLGGQAFLRSLTKYMKEMSHDLATACNGGTTPRDGSVDGNAVGCPQNAKAFMQNLMISDEDLEGLLNVLRCEMDRHQVVPKHRAHEHGGERCYTHTLNLDRVSS